MGDYTELLLIAKKGERYKEIEHLFNDEGLTYEGFDGPGTLWSEQPHEFFRSNRVSFFLNKYGANDVGEPCIQHVEPDILRVHTSIKNYDGAIEKFLDWISPYLDHSTLDGYQHFEYWHNKIPFVSKAGVIVLDERVPMYRNMDKPYWMYDI